MDFAALDVETANSDMASICQVGIAVYEQGMLTREWKTLVDPLDSFDGINTSIHGIDARAVIGAPTFSDITTTIAEVIGMRIVVSHTHFDRVSMNRAFAKSRLASPEWIWLDSARVARRAWEEFARGGYGLKPVCNSIGYEFAHHDALEDAKASAQILLAAAAKTGLDVNGWLDRVRRPIFLSTTGSDGVARDGNPEGSMFGEVVVFTGALVIPRRDAADKAAEIGCRVAESVNKTTTMLVVGDQDIRKFAGQDKSTKHRKAEELILKGQAIRIIGESDFLELVNLA